MQCLNALLPADIGITLHAYGQQTSFYSLYALTVIFSQPLQPFSGRGFIPFADDVSLSICNRLEIYARIRIAPTIFWSVLVIGLPLHRCLREFRIRSGVLP